MPEEIKGLAMVKEEADGKFSVEMPGFHFGTFESKEVAEFKCEAFNVAFRYFVKVAEERAYKKMEQILERKTWEWSADRRALLATPGAEYFREAIREIRNLAKTEKDAQP